MKYLSFAKTHGGKGDKKILKWILSNFPVNYTQLKYAEPCVGGGSVALNKEASIFEAINDIDYATYCMYSHIKNPASGFDMVYVFQYKENTFFNHKWGKDSEPKTIGEVAIHEYILRNMSRGGLKKDFSWSDRQRGGLPEGVNAWVNKTGQLLEIRKRLENVELFNEDIIPFLQRFNTRDCFTYIDPPYLQETRTTKKVYTHEMSPRQHEDLLDFLTLEWKGSFLLSGYASTLYDNKLKSYNKKELQVANHANQQKKKSRRVECLWFNY